MIPVVNQSVFISGCCLRDARFIAALLCQHGPGDACQLVSKGRGQNVRMQALSGTNEPGSEAMLRPVCRPQQNNPGCLHEERAQVTVAALGAALLAGSNFCCCHHFKIDISYDSAFVDHQGDPR